MPLADIRGIYRIENAHSFVKYAHCCYELAGSPGAGVDLPAAGCVTRMSLLHEHVLLQRSSRL